MDFGECTRLRKSDTDCAANVLADAFRHDPLYEYLIADGCERARVLPLFFECFLQITSDVTDVWCRGTPPVGVSIWIAPWQQDECLRHLDVARKRALPGIMGELAATQFMKIVDWQDGLHRDLIQHPHWHLLLLGVAPRWQRQGIGSSLVRHVFDEADRKRQCCYLETQQPANGPFYEGLGFDVAVDQALEPSSGLPVWTFIRNPRTP